MKLLTLKVSDKDAELFKHNNGVFSWDYEDVCLYEIVRVEDVGDD